jgi:hypothetical protein
MPSHSYHEGCGVDSGENRITTERAVIRSVLGSIFRHEEQTFIEASIEFTIKYYNKKLFKSLESANKMSLSSRKLFFS